MDIPHNALIAVADGRKMLILRNNGNPMKPDLTVLAHGEQRNPDTHEQGGDRPGRTHAPSGSLSASYEEADFHEIAEGRFATEVAAHINQRALANGFDKLIVVAPPRTLGDLRSQWHKETQARLIGEIPKEATNLPPAGIAALIDAS